MGKVQYCKKLNKHKLTIQARPGGLCKRRKITGDFNYGCAIGCKSGKKRRKNVK